MSRASDYHDFVRKNYSKAQTLAVATGKAKDTQKFLSILWAKHKQRKLKQFKRSFPTIREKHKRGGWNEIMS